jgi:hypothetical protein
LAGQYELMSGGDSTTNAFDWQEEFPEAFRDGGFDAVIGNPPYVLLQDQLRNDAQLAYFRANYAVAAYKVDTYHLFIERGFALAKPGGVVAMITPSNFLTNNHLALLRRMMLEKSRITELMIVDGGVFDGISVDNAIFAFEIGRPAGKQFDVTYARPEHGTLRVTSQQAIGVKAALDDPHVLFTGATGKKAAALWQKIESKSVALETLADVNFGKQLRDRKKFLRDVIEVESLSEVPRGYRACYTGRDVGRYSVTWNGLACLNKEEARSGGCWDPEKQDAKNKLLTKQIGRVPEFGIDTAGHQCLNTMFMVNVRDGDVDPYLLLAQLNSRISHAVWLDRFYDRRRTFPKIKGTYLKQLPVMSLDPANASHRAAAKRLRELAEKALSLRLRMAGTKNGLDDQRVERHITPVERAIDTELYKLYGLTDAEIAIVEAIVAAPPE